MDDYVQIAYPSFTGTGTVQARLYPPQPLSAANGLLVQIIHGMAEHMQRYDAFCRFLAGKGLAVCIHDQAGHGSSASSPENLGYFGEIDGVENVQKDISRLAELTLEKLNQLSDGQISWRRVIIGHSMGSFISRCYCTRPESKLAGAIFSGTAGSNPALPLALYLSRRSVRKNGPLYRDIFLQKLSGKDNLKRIPNHKTEFDWLTRDQDIVDAYIADPCCGYAFTAAGYRDLFTFLNMISKKSWAKSVPAELPILLIAGADDPIGAYGAGPLQVQKRLLKTGHLASLEIYCGCRHEVLNEINKQQIWQDVLDWLLALPVLDEK